LTFDVPGLGASRDIPLGPDTKLHSAFLEILRANPKIDSDRIGAVGKSLGGNIATRLAFTETNKLKAVANVCGPVDQVMHISTEGIDENFPEMTIDALWSRFKVGRKDHHDFDQVWGTFSLVTDRYIAEGKKLPIPLLAYNTPSDPVNPLWEMYLLKKISTNGEVFIAGGEGHCPGNENSTVLIDWFAEKLEVNR
jgi:pimeloyl-ACP methyl ester carboxylesterase